MSHDSAINQGGANKSLNQSECISSQPIANGILPHHKTGKTNHHLLLKRKTKKTIDVVAFDWSVTSGSASGCIKSLPVGGHQLSLTGRMSSGFNTTGRRIIKQNNLLHHDTLSPNVGFLSIWSLPTEPPVTQTIYRDLTLYALTHQHWHALNGWFSF